MFFLYRFSRKNKIKHSFRKKHYSEYVHELNKQFITNYY